MEAERLRAWEIAPEAIERLRAVEACIQHSGVPRRLVELVKMRASQINGCAYCLDRHAREARSGGETEQRLHVLSAWRESEVYSSRERAALAWTEAVTDIARTRAPDDVYEALQPHFSAKEIVDLTVLIGLINLRNRVAIACRYQPPLGAAAPVSEAGAGELSDA